ncbi:hypothetical protein J2X63_003492 [Agromyces sp. 3263]|uniref:hypothetical protein n=1 Tax=Agromyces sp. 3263 TaxID=2817750 RepID=UPI0028573242|nr:hypothetical protein [Agromyces sp. 3263]MDR6907784.1 hypothetical protein [Agromyces sp. 3263]
MTGHPSDDYRARHVIGAPGCLFIFGAVIPLFWAVGQVFTTAIGNSATFRSWDPTADRTPYAEVPGLWATAGMLTLTALALAWMIYRYTTARTPRTISFAIVAATAALGNWVILFG